MEVGGSRTGSLKRGWCDGEKKIEEKIEERGRERVSKKIREENRKSSYL